MDKKNSDLKKKIHLFLFFSLFLHLYNGNSLAGLLQFFAVPLYTYEHQAWHSSKIDFLGNVSNNQYNRGKGMLTMRSLITFCASKQNKSYECRKKT